MTASVHSAETSESQLDLILDAAVTAASRWADFTPSARARVLTAVADALEAQSSSLVQEALAETGLPEPRLTGEVARTCMQLRMFAEELNTGQFLDVVIDRADPDFVLGPRPELRRYQIPVGPALVFAAGNFPFAFSVAGTDTASALAAGCPVLVKAHPGHPHTSAATAAIIDDALASAGAPRGTFALVTGLDAGIRALKDPRITAAAFTGSVAGGRALFDIAAARPIPIPFYGELGSINPVIITAGALTERADELAAGFVESFTRTAGQLCTKPGILLIPTGSDIAATIAALSREIPAARMLTKKIADGFSSRIKDAMETSGIEVLLEGGASGEEGEIPHVTPTLLRTSAEHVITHADTLLEESFGPATIIAEYSSNDEVLRLLAAIDGTLTVTVHTPAAPGEIELDELRTLTHVAATRTGRLLFNGWPTGVAVTPAQHHGGPYPATTSIAHTSVGTAAMRRFLRPVVYQDAPPELLPLPVQEDNPLQIPRTLNTAGQSPAWGRSIS